MPQFKVTGPDGKSYRVNAPSGASQNDAIAYVANTYYGGGAPAPVTPEAAPTPEQPKEGPGFFGALKRGFTSLGELPEAIGFAMGDEEARKELAKPPEETAGGFGMDKSLGENWEALKEMAGESIGFMAAPAAAGLAGSLAGGPLVGGGAAIATLLSQYGTENLARQAQEDEARIARGEAPLGAMPGRAAAAAVGQAGLDVAGFAVPALRPLAAAFPFMRPLLGQAGKKAVKETAEAIAEAAAKKQLTIKGGIARGIAQGVAFEIPQETAQTVLERAQAGLSLDDDSAIEEYKQAAIGAAVLGGGFGGIGGGIEAARERIPETQAAKAREAAAQADLATDEEKAEFGRLLTNAANEYAAANPDVTTAQDILKALRDDGTLGALGRQARANVEAAQAQAETGAGLDGGAGRPDVDVAGTAESSVPVAGAPTPTGEDTQTVPQAEPIGVAGAGEPAGRAAASEAGAVGALTPETYVDRYLAGEGRGNTPVDLELQQYAANFGPEIEAEFARRQAPPVAEGEYNPDLVPAYMAETSVAKQRAIAPVVANIFAQVTGLEGFNTPKMKALPDNVQKAFNTSIQKILAATKTAQAIDPEAVVRAQLAEYNVALPEAAAPTTEAPSVVEEGTAPEAAPVKQAAPTVERQGEAAPAAEVEVTPPSAPAYTYADLIKEAESLTVTSPALAEFAGQAEAVAAAAEQGVPVPSPVELRQRLYEAAGREAPPLEAEAAPAAELAAAEEYDPEAFSAAQERAPRLWSTFSKQVKGKSVPAWEELDEEAQDNFIGTIMAAPVDATPLEFTAAVRPVFNAIRTGKPIPATRAKTAMAAPIFGGVEVDIDAFRGKTLTQLLDHIILNEDGKYSQVDEFLAVRLNKLLDELQDAGANVVLHIIQEGDSAPRSIARGTSRGMADTDLKAKTVDIYLRSPTLGVESSGGTTEVILHEALHAISSGVLLAVKNGRGTPAMVQFRKDLNSLRNAVIDHFNNRVRSGAELTDFERSMYERTTNAFADLDEFLAWGLTNKQAQDYLRTIKVGPGKSLFSRFLAMFWSLLGINPNDTSALARLVDIVDPLFSSTTAEDYKTTFAAEDKTSAAMAAKGPKKAAQPKKPRVVKINKAKMQWAMREAGLMRRRNDAFRKKINQSKNTHQLNDSIGEMFFGTRAYQGPMNMLRLLRDSLTPQAKRIILPFLPTDDITRWIGDRLPGVANINKLVDDLTIFRNKRHEKTSVIANKWMKFMTAFPKGADVLDVLIKLADYHDVDPTQAATPEEYAKNDPEMKRLIKENASKQKRENRLSAIKEVYAEWRLLGQSQYGNGTGREIFKLAKEAYRRNLVDSYIMTINRITKAGMSPENEKAAVSQIKFMYKEALARRAYFPAMRYGQYWFSVGKGPNIEYYMFESALQRDMAFAQRKQDMTKENDVRDIIKGNDYKEVTEYLTSGRDASVALKNVFDMLDSGKAEDTAQLKDTIFQMYLLALPEGDMRKRFSHRRYVTGFGMDSMRDFVAAQNRAASQLARLSYAHQMRDSLKLLEKDARERGDFIELEPFVREISERAKAEIDPPLRGGFYAWLDKFAGLGNKFVFLWMLTAPKSALIQATQLHTVGLPVLSDEFGLGKVMKIAGRYSMDIMLGNKLALHRKDANGDIVTEFDLNMRNAKFMQDLKKSDPAKYKLLAEAYDYADQRGTFASTFTNDLNEMASRPTKEAGAVAALRRGRPLSAARQGSEAAMQFMSVAFHQMENLNRQIMYMTSFELAYEKAKKAGLSDTAAKEQAMESALKITRETMFNYSNYNKPRAFKSLAGRIATQFMTYPVMMTSYLVRNFKGMLPGLSAEGKMSAAKRLFGTIGMTGMYAGLTGLPLYSVFMLAAEAAREMLRDDDDFAPYEDDKGNPVGKVNLKYWFENSWLPETFGPDSSIAKALNLPPEMAVLLERSVKFGPVSALSDINVAASTSLDSLFFRGDVKADTLDGQFKEMLYNQLLGPLGGLISNMTRGVQLYDEGETTRAMEFLLPAFVKGAVRASRLQEEGLRTIDGKVLKDADFYNEGKLFSQILGFGSTETYEMQKQNIEGQQIQEEIEAERSKLIQQVKSAESRFINKPTEANRRLADKTYEELEKYNNRFPLSAIEGESVATALTNALKEQAESVGGAQYNPKVPVMEDVIARRIAWERGQ